MTTGKYGSIRAPFLPDRRWPSALLTNAPRWCSVDLRDGNQALPVTMGIAEKLEMFRLLCDIGFREIEVGFPAASQVEFDFVRLLIEEGLVPDDVTIQVITQAREHIIERTLASLRGARRAVINLYNSTSPRQRDVVFRKTKEETVDMAVKAARLIRRGAEAMEGSEIIYQYCPESFSATEPEFALAVCEAVMDAWEPCAERPVILNLAASVEVSAPNVFADQVEWFCRHIASRDSITVGVHTHNDRGTAVAATELALLAGADRVEGTLFGNGERAGNADLMTIALNLFSQGIDPGLNLDDIPRIVDVYERCTGMRVYQRHPYAGELVYTTFAGSHQDAIVKGLRHGERSEDNRWDVPYLPIDPADIGRIDERFIRLNSHSGRTGIEFVLEAGKRGCE